MLRQQTSRKWDDLLMPKFHKWDKTLEKVGQKRQKPFQARGPYRTTCLICDKPVLEGRRKYCSRKCSKKAFYVPNTARILKMTRAIYCALIEQQKGACAICGSVGPLVLDHCHTAVAFRGLLCNLCNVGLGAFRDDPALLRQAARYLKNNPWAL